MNRRTEINTVATLPSHYYFDPAHYQREMEALWYRQWICVGRFDDLNEPGDFRVVEVGDQSIFITRDSKRRIKAFYNTCRHRGSVLCENERGRFNDGRIVCPYHAWTYSLEGHLVKTPWRLPCDDFEFERFSLYRVGAVEWVGYVFVNLDAEEDPALEDVLKTIPAKFTNWHLETTQVAHRLQIDLDCNWKIFWENFDECYHCPGVHPELCQIVPTYGKGYSSPSENPEWQPPDPANTDYVEPRLAPGAVTWTLDGKTPLPTFEHLNQKQREQGHTYGVSVPSFYLVGHVDYARLVHMMPIAPEKTRLTVDWMLNEESVTSPEVDLEKVIGLGQLVVEQDGRACEINQKGLKSRRHVAGVLVTQELGIAEFHQWVLDGVGPS